MARKKKNVEVSLDSALVSAQTTPSTDPSAPTSIPLAASSVEPELNNNLATTLSKSTDALVTINSSTAKSKYIKDQYRKTTFQARLGRKLDNIQRKVSDDILRLSSHPTDMLRIRVTRDDITRDIVSRSIVSSEIMPILLPPMEKIPLRHLQGFRQGAETTIPSLYTLQQQEYFEIYAPVQCKLEPDDLLVRMIYDDVNCPDDPYVMILQVSEQLATIGYSSIRYHIYWCTFYNEQLPDKIINIIRLAQKKREILNW